MIELADVLAAAERLRGRIVETPLMRSQVLSEITGADIHVKFENLQFTASFKERGALNRLLTLDPAVRARGVSAMSAGNHAQGVAYHAQKLGVAATIVMPRTTPLIKVEQTRGHGAEVVLAGDTLADAQAECARITEARGLTLIHPFDDPEVIAGQGTVGLEILSAGAAIDTIVAPVGGGGLISGIATVARAMQPPVEVFGVQAAGYPSMRRALRGEAAEAGGNTVAEGIAVKYPGRLTQEIVRERVADILLVGEPDLERSVALFLNIEKTVAEGAGAAALACLLAHPERFRGRKVALVLSGGNIDSRLLSSIMMRELLREHRIVTVTMPIPDRPGVLARIAAVIAEAEANVLDILHRRTSLELLAKDAVIEITFETRGRAHADQVVEGLRASGFDPKVISA